MKRYFISYGDERFAGAKLRVQREAMATGQFDEIIVHGPEDVSESVRNSPLWNQRRGGGYWIWKPDVIYRTLTAAADGDIVLYVDSGCELARGREWQHYWRILEQKELIAQRIYQVNRNWTRQSVREEFADLPETWLNQCQYMATAIFFKKTALTLRLVAEWRRLMIEHPEMVDDVSDSERPLEPPELIENRHDQTLFSALIYRLLANPETRDRIHTQWEHVEDLSLFRSQVIRAMRNNTEKPVPMIRRLKARLWRLAKDLLRKPYFIMLHGG